MKETNYQLSLRENEILGFLSQYLTVGGFPEWFEVKNEDAWFKILSEEYTSLLLYKDIIKVFSIRDPLLLESIFKFVATHLGERFSYLGIAKENDGDKETSRHYIFHLAHARLIHLSGFYTKSRKASERKEKKIFFCDVGLKNSFGRVQDVGHDAENVAFLHYLIEG
ncbi:MAG: ATP-binding protein [ANME-2 cluster archaeon]|nr:ATP-binding protein [ANME-2 cluster archaeon]